MSVLDVLFWAADSLDRRYAYEKGKAQDLAADTMREPADKLYASALKAQADAVLLRELREALAVFRDRALCDQDDVLAVERDCGNCVSCWLAALLSPAASPPGENP
jgi:hypothetical protein